MRRHISKLRSFEALEAKKLMTADIGIEAPMTLEPQGEMAEVGSPMTGDLGHAEQSTAYLKYKLDRVFVKSWSTSGDADDRPTEEVAFYYNKVQPSATMTGYLKIPDIDGESQNSQDSGEWFGVEREMKESGEKGGTTDINIGVGELQECTISKSMDTASLR